MAPRKSKHGLESHAALIKVLAQKQYPIEFKKMILRYAPNDTILKICEVVYNILKGVIPLSKRQKHQLGSKKQVLRKLVHPQLTTPQRRRILTNQQGGILPILPLLASLLGAIASPILKTL